MRFLLDENVHAKLKSALEKLGHDVALVKKSSSDIVVASQAKKQKRILLTHDGDFLNADLDSPDSNWGIVIIRISPSRIEEMEKVLKESLANMPEELILGKTWFLFQVGLTEVTEKLSKTD